MLIFISQWLLNLIYSMTKALNGQIPPSKIPNPLFHLSMLFEKPCFNYLFPFNSFPFSFQTF